MRIVEYSASIRKTKKPANQMICRFLRILDIAICGEKGTPLQNLEGILAIIKEVTKKKKDDE